MARKEKLKKPVKLGAAGPEKAGKRRAKPGKAALREISRQQRSTQSLLKRTPMARLIRSAPARPRTSPTPAQPTYPVPARSRPTQPPSFFQARARCASRRRPSTRSLRQRKPKSCIFLDRQVGPMRCALAPHHANPPPSPRPTTLRASGVRSFFLFARPSGHVAHPTPSRRKDGPDPRCGRTPRAWPNQASLRSSCRYAFSIKV